MAYWILMFFCVFITPFIMLLFGLYFRKGKPEEPNWAFGYRTKLSMQNHDTWHVAHTYCGKLWVNISKIIIPVSIVPMLFCINTDTKTIGTVTGILCVTQIVPLIGSIFIVERHLNKIFYKDGTRKENE